MIKIKSVNAQHKYEISINNIKYLMGPNRLQKEDFMNQIKRIFYKLDNSEYAYEQKINTTTTIDEKTIKLKTWRLLDIHAHINVNQEISLGTKSMMHQYVEMLLRDIEYMEEINTINLLFEQIAIQLSEKMIEFNQINIDAKFEQMTQKQLIKLLELRFISENQLMDYLDLNYEARILFQIKMAESIAEKNVLLKYLVFVDLPKMTVKIQEELSNIRLDNMFVIVLVEEKINVEIRNSAYFGKRNIDFSDDISIYNDLIMEIDQVYNLDEMKCVIKKFVNGVDDKDTKRLEKFL